jgi:dihydroneopterin aldolase
MDKVFLRGLKCQATIGVWQWERKIKQTLVLDIELMTDITRASESDELEHALNYQQVAERVTEVVSESEFLLLEALIKKVADTILDEFEVREVTIRMDKGSAVSNVKSVGVEITRNKA